MTHHYFLGIPIEIQYHLWLEKWQNQLRENFNYGVWTHPGDLHITLTFLGGVDGEQLNQLTEVLDTMRMPEQFNLTIGSLGSFGNSSQPRVVWAGVEHHEKLLDLYSIVSNGCLKAGFPKENRPYRPHITLAKKWRKPASEHNQDISIKASVEESETIDRMLVDRVCLFKIHPQKKKKYEIIKTWYLSE